MDVPDAVFEAVQARDDVAIAGAEYVMTSVENQSDGLRIGELQKTCNLPRSLDVPAAMVVKHRLQSGGITNGSGDRVCAFRENLPFVRGQPHLWSDSPCIQCALRHAAIVICEHK